jgi:hypothetical protein
MPMMGIPGGASSFQHSGARGSGAKRVLPPRNTATGSGGRAKAEMPISARGFPVQIVSSGGPATSSYLPLTGGTPGGTPTAPTAPASTQSGGVNSSTLLGIAVVLGLVVFGSGLVRRSF